MIYSYGPMVGIYIAFQNFNPAKLFSSLWVGLENFRYVLEIPGSLRVVWNTLYIAVFKIIGMIVVLVTFALLLNEVR